MSSFPSIVVLTNGNARARRILAPLLAERREWQVAVIVHVTGDYSGRTGIPAALRLAGRMALPFWLWKVALAVAERMPLASNESDELEAFGIPVLRVDRVNDPGVHQVMREVSPSLIVSVSCPQKVPASLLAVADLGGVNIHSSLLPRYAGLAPYFWVLADGCAWTGTTVHWMTERFDKGRVLRQVWYRVPRGISAHALFDRLAGLGSAALVEGVRRALRSEVGEEQGHDCGSYRSHPRFGDWLRAHRNGHPLMRPADWSSLFSHFLEGSNAS